MLETWTAPNGRRITIRPIRAADFALEKEFLERLSPATGYQRLMSARRPSTEEIKRFTDIDYQRELALIATTAEDGGERQIGVARYVKNERAPGEAEFAIVLSDDWQGCGLGTKLLASLLGAARSQGVRRIVATTLSANGAMLALARRMGFKLSLNPDSATVTNLTLDLSS
jgi:RimJ/RimL family protein N-acetyltransferase